MNRSLHSNIKFSILTTLSILFIFSISFSQPVSWSARGIGGGGALFAPSISPFNTNEMYLACDMTEIFHTTNAGASWATVPFQQLASVTTSKIQFTSDPAILYAVNTNFYTEETFPVKSADGGVSWSAISDPTGGECYSIFADGAATNRIIINSYNKIYFSNNSGTSFTTIYTNMASGAAHIGGVFWDGTSIYIGAAKNLIVSSDNGATFTPNTLTGFAAGRGILSFCGAKSAGITRFFCTSFNLSDIYPGITGADYSEYKAIYKMDYAIGASWVSASSGITSSNKPFYISMAVNNITTAYCAGGNITTDYPIVFKTTDGGANWNAVFLTTNNQNIYTGYQGYNGDEGWYYDEFAEGFSVAQNNTNVAVITGLGYAHYTNDGGATWQQQYVNSADENAMNTAIVKGKNYASSGLENTSCWSICWSDINTLVAGFTDITGMQSSDAGIKWNKSLNGLTENTIYKLVKENASGKIYAATSSVHDLYESTYLQDVKIDGGLGAIKYSTDNGINWSILHDFTKPVVSITIDPNTANKMYACVVNSVSGGIYVSSNIHLGASSTWVKLNNPPRTQGHPYSLQVLNDGTLIAVYSGRRDAVGTFTNSSGVFKSTDGGTTWTDVSDTGMYYWTKDLIIDNTDITQNTWYCCVFSGWGGPPNGLGGIYKTTNRGASWTRINASDRVESCTINPTNANEMYFSTESEGLWVTENLNAPSPLFSQLTSYPFMHPMRIFFNPFNTNEIWISSFGNGMKMALLNTCAKPTGLTATSVTSTSATISWTAIAGATSYKITRKVTGGGTYNYNAITNAITMTDLTPGTTNKITVKSKCGVVFSDKSNTLNVITPLRTKNISEKTFAVYPNPANDYLHVTFYAAQNIQTTISIYSIQGQLINVLFSDSPTTGGQKEITLPVSNLVDGIYILKFESEGDIQTKTCIIEK